MLWVVNVIVIFNSIHRLATCELLQLTDNNFVQKIENEAWILVMFQTPWCISCKQLKSEFEKIESILDENSPRVVLGSVDCSDKGRATCDQFTIISYPIMILFNHGKLVSRFKSPKESKGIAKYVRAHIVSPVALLSTSEELNQFLNDTYINIIGFLNDLSHLRDILYTAAEKFKEQMFFGITTPNLSHFSEAFSNFSNTIVLFRPEYLHNNFEEKYLIFNGTTNEEFEEWLTKNKHGLVGHRTRENKHHFPLPIIVAYYNIDFAKNPKVTNYWRNRILKVAANYSDDFIFAISSKNDFQAELMEYGFGYFYAEKPIIVARTVEHKKYKMDEEFSIESFLNFLEGVKSGTLEPYIKSEPIPDNSNKIVKVAVARNFDSLILNREEDVVLHLYASWCIQCKQSATVFENVATKLKNEKLLFVKMNARKNDVLHIFSTDKFPKIYFIPKHLKFKPIVFGDEIEADNLIKFIALHSTEELRGYDRDGISRSKYEL